MKLIIGNALTYFKFNDSEKASERNNIKNQFNYHLNPLQPYRYKIMAFRRHIWDGREHIVNLSKQYFPTGFLSDVIKILHQTKQYYPNLSVKIIDNRAQTIKAEVPNKMKVGKYYLRDYQLKGIKEAIKHQRVIINSATNSGKTAIAIGIIKIALHALDDTDNILLFTQSKDVTYQNKQSFEKGLGVPVGMLGGGHHTTHQVTCATARTLSSGLKDPAQNVKLTSRTDKICEYMAKKYAPIFMHRHNKGLLIKSFINTHTPRYSYDSTCFQYLALVTNWSDSKITKFFQGYINSYDQIIKNKNKGKYLKYKHMKDYLNSVKIVFVDEAQHAPANSFRKVLRNLPNARIRVAMTGTVPTNKVKHAIFVAEFGHHIMKVSNHTLIKRGISAIPLVTKIPITECSKLLPDDRTVNFNLENEVAKEVPVGLPKNQLSLFLYQKEYNLGVIHNTYRNKVIARVAYQLYHLRKKSVTLIVVSSLPQGKAIEDQIEMLNQNIPDCNLTYRFFRGANDSATRNKTLRETKQGKIRVLIATQVIDEGLNIPNLSNMVYASAGKSSVELLQRIGRLLRKYPGQKHVYIFDLIDKTSDILYKQALQRLHIYKKQQFKIMN